MESNFSKQAGAHRFYIFRLLEPTGVPHRFTLTRNGAVLELTGELALPVNPEEVIREQPARSTVTQTPHSAWVDDYGMGLPRWTIRGTMGFHRKPALGVVGPQSALDGYSGYHAFADLIEEYYTENRRRATQAATGQGYIPPLRLEFLDTWDDDAWLIQPEALPTKHRNVSHNPVIKYDFKFTGTHDLRTRSASPRVTDAIGSALLGGNGRQAAIARAITAHAVTLDAEIAALESLEQSFPGLASQLQDFMRCGNTTQFSESTAGLRQRDSLFGLATTTEDDLANTLTEAKTVGTVSPALESAMTTSIQQSRLLGGGSVCGSRVDVGTIQAGWASSLDSIAGATSGGAGDDFILGLFTPSNIANLKGSGSGAVSLLQAASAGDLSQVPGFTTASAFFRETIAPVSALGSDVLDVARGVKGAITVGLSTVNATVRRMRQALSSVQAALYQLRVLSSAARQLRNIKRSLNQYMCAIQSILAFPYLFARDLRESMQALLDLFELSGCATSFPNLRPLSWQPNIEIPRVITA